MAGGMGVWGGRERERERPGGPGDRLEGRRDGGGLSDCQSLALPLQEGCRDGEHVLVWALPLPPCVSALVCFL